MRTLTRISTALTLFRSRCLSLKCFAFRQFSLFQLMAAAACPFSFGASTFELGAFGHRVHAGIGQALLTINRVRDISGSASCLAPASPVS